LIDEGPAFMGTQQDSMKPIFAIGARIELKLSAGRRLAGRTGKVIGIGRHPGSLRLMLDGSKSPITLHQTYLVPEDLAIADGREPSP
jgi:hypothetical protein